MKFNYFGFTSKIIPLPFQLNKCIWCSVILLFCNCLSFGQTAELNKSILERKPEKFYLNFLSEPKNLRQFLWSVFDSTNTPAGISLAYNEEPYEEKYKTQPQDLSLKDMLDSFVKVKPEYNWKETNGVINVFPQNDYLILDAQIEEFKGEDYPWELQKKLIQTPEFQDYLKLRNLIDTIPDPENKKGFFITGFFGKPDPRQKISIYLKNSTVREILNEIVRSSKKQK